jgi:excisionase family DNA binding protein
MQIDVSTWLTVRQVTRQLNLSQPYVSRLILSGRLSAVRTPLGYFVSPESVAALKAERTASPIVQRRAANAC